MSKAYDQLTENIEEIDGLMEAHAQAAGGGRPGRPERRAQVLNKSAIVLLCAFWQSYCEEVLTEILAALARGKLSDVPASLRVAVGKRFFSKKRPDPKAVWTLAGRGWRAEISALVTRLNDDKSRPLDSPNSAEVAETFKAYLAVRNIRTNWHCQGMSHSSACEKLDRFIKIRHRIAHRGHDERTVRKSDVDNFGFLIGRLAYYTDNALEAAGFLD
jgi:hypothetical protein